MVNESSRAACASLRAVLLLHGQNPSWGPESEASPPVLPRFESDGVELPPTARLSQAQKGFKQV